MAKKKPTRTELPSVPSMPSADDAYNEGTLALEQALAINNALDILLDWGATCALPENDLCALYGLQRKILEDAGEAFRRARS